MYNFVDTTEYQAPNSVRPAEAMRFNGWWLEDEIPGYRTLYTSGRESIPADITDQEVGTRDGNRYQRRRYTPRTIIVGYQLIAQDSETFRRMYNKLNALLGDEEVQIVFADEMDKYFIGTVVSVGDVPTGRNSVTAEIEIYCADPFKYGIEEKEISPNIGDTIAYRFNYQGSYRTFPTLEAEIGSDCGFISYLHQNGSRILIGNEDEPDGTTYQMSETIVNDEFLSEVPTTWTVNNANLYFTSEYAQVGSVAIGKTIKGKNGMYALDYGSGSGWHGPSITRILPADSNGHVGAGNFALRWNHLFSSDSQSDRNVFQVIVNGYDSKGKRVNIAGITFYKFSTGDNNCHAAMFVNGKGVKSIDFSRGLDNPVTGVDVSQTSIERLLGDTIVFGFANDRYGFEVPEIADIEAREISFYFGVYSEGTPGVNSLYNVKFISMNVDNFSDEPNLFSAGDTIIVDCKDGDIFVNGNSAPQYGDTKNGWEQFFLSPGENHIECVNSPWATVTPTYKMRYREVFL